MSTNKNLEEERTTLGGDAPATTTSNHLDSSTKSRIDALDIRLKERQIIKTEFEIAQLKNTWPRLLDIVNKTGIPIVVFVTGVAAYIGLPQATLALGKARTATELAQNQLADVIKQRGGIKAEVIGLNGENLALKKQRARDKKEITAADVAVTEAVGVIKNSLKGNDMVFIQFKGDVTRDTINGLRTALTSTGFKSPPAERIDRNQKNLVKYFSNSPDEKARATKVAATTKDFFEKQLCPLSEVEVKKVDLPGGKNAPIELWLNHACKTTQP